MPKGDIRRNPTTGDVIQLQQVGNQLQWVELSDDDASVATEAAELGKVGAFAAGGLRSLSFGALDAPEGISGQLQQQFPGSSLAGELSPLGGAIAGGIGRAATKRVTAAMGQELGEQAARGAAKSPQLIRRPSNVLGRATAAGQTARGLEAGAEAIPGLNLPLLRQATINQRRTNESFARAMGLSDEVAVKARTAGADGKVIAETLKMFDEGYGKVANAVNQHVDIARVRGLIDEAAEKGYIRRKLKSLVKQPGLNGDDVMAVRSELSRLSRSSTESRLVINDIDDILEGIDEIIEEAVKLSGDDAAEQTLKTLNSRYAVFREMRKGRSIGADGQINPRTSDGRFSGRFGDRYAAGEDLFQDENVNRFMDIIREGAELDVGLPSSGTTERAVGALVIAGGGGALASQ